MLFRSPYLFTHELVEQSLIFPKDGRRVLPDVKWGWFLFKGYLQNHTRWFREGFSDYAGYLAYEMTCSDINLEIPLARLRAMHEHPFSSLSRVGEDLFTWHQHSNKELNSDYYNAALGLFLLIRYEFGEVAIRRIIRGLDSIDYIDGPALIKLINKTLNTNVKKLADDFQFPETGLEIEPLTPAKALNEEIGKASGRERV